MADNQKNTPEDELSAEELEQAAGGLAADQEFAVADNTNCGSGNCNC